LLIGLAAPGIARRRRRRQIARLWRAVRLRGRAVPRWRPLGCTAVRPLTLASEAGLG
jgi:hypothetical protein